MSSILDLLPIITIFTIGASIWFVLIQIKPFNFRKTELFNIFLLIGSFVLIIPLTWIGIQPNGAIAISTQNDLITLIDFHGWCQIYFILGLILSILLGYFSLRKILINLEDFQFNVDILKDYRFILLSFLLVDYLFLSLILPLRGFDALYYYFPEAEVFYQADRITEINYLSFLPVVKSPLNVLLYVYCYYCTKTMGIQLIPYIFLVGLVLVIYDFAIELFHEKSIAILAAILTLSLPFTYWLINYWAFYQDLYLCYYFSIACYFSLKWYRNESNLYNGIFMGLGIIISLLTKITAWTLPLILILWLPTKKKGKIVRLMILPILAGFLVVQAITRIYIGTAFPIIISIGVTGYLIIKEISPDFRSHGLLRQIPIFLSMTVGSFWILNRISLSKSVWAEIYDLYFHLSETIQWYYPNQPSNPLLYTLESVHRTNFFSAITFLFLGTAFVLPWISLKVNAAKSYQAITAPLIWILIFLSIWTTYYLTGSMRYLAPIIAPIVICCAWGLHNIMLKIEERTKKDLLIALIAFLGCANFYYLINVQSLIITDQTQENIGLAYNQAALNYYSHPEILGLITIGFFGLILIFTKNETSMLNKLTKYFNPILIRNIFLLGVIIIPVAVQSYLLFYTKGDFNQFQAIHEYEYRPEYQELVTVIQQQNQPLSVILTVRTPGLQFFTKQPAIDIYYQRNLFRDDPFFTNNNITELMDILQYPLNYTIQTDLDIDIDFSIKFILVPSTSNIYYDVYVSQIKRRCILFRLLNVNPAFDLLFENSDFLLYEFTYPSTLDS